MGDLQPRLRCCLTSCPRCCGGLPPASAKTPCRWLPAQRQDGSSVHQSGEDVPRGWRDLPQGAGAAATSGGQVRPEPALQMALCSVLGLTSAGASWPLRGWPFVGSVSCLPTSAPYLGPGTLSSRSHSRPPLGPVLLKPPSPVLFAGNPPEAARKPFGNRAQAAGRPQLSAHRP